jgi:hypothetical protein
MDDLASLAGSFRVLRYLWQADGLRASVLVFEVSDSRG